MTSGHSRHLTEPANPPAQLAPSPMSVPVTAPTPLALPQLSRTYLVKAAPYTDSEVYGVQHHQQIHGMRRSANSPSPQAASSTSASSTPLTAAAHHPRARYPPIASPQTQRGYDWDPHAAHPPFHSSLIPPPYQRQPHFAAASDSADVAFPHPHPYRRYAHALPGAPPHAFRTGAPAAALHHDNYRLPMRPPPMHSLDATSGATITAKLARPSQHPPPTHVAAPPHVRPYDLQSPAPASRTFWNHYETGLLVQLWLEFEPQFLANKRNAGVWTQLAQRLTERSGRRRTVRECRIKWKNMWAKHRDLVNASHMSPDAKLREFPHFSEFSAIRQRGSLHQQTQHAGAIDVSEGKRTPHDDDHHTPSSAAEPGGSGGLALEQLLVDPAGIESSRMQLRQSSVSTLAFGAPSADSGSPDTRPAQHELALYDLPRMLHQLDCFPSHDTSDAEAQYAQLSAESVVEQMQALASTSSSADISAAAQLIMSYVERESRRRQQQSERHHTIIAALADILARSSVPPTAATSASTSRRSSGMLRGWLPAGQTATTADAVTDTATGVGGSGRSPGLAATSGRASTTSRGSEPRA
ncbi:hypothetical protein COEREDRAFT_17886 [Coemansia reversa NRRL 1564]|uniref:Myb-like domain-containing protein n=1 Tax=Coemansia reversa (strain ATCC 12441 / NRRL 1564) TaxID=763665 RepID=A0A2G5B2F8_COERN|nr:hypothetical protein COEREDRAFT_17886 [Coemansia reversa NRRL 1564]|eukprot:PIA12897.1 hypothetical protein COEREDRAFT_17886 [Coemansia reversa NRRL 1564]